MSELNKLSIIEANKLLKNKEISVKELVGKHFEQIKKHQEINAFITLTEEKAMVSAEHSQKMINEGKGRLLEGIPVGVKDLFCTKDVLTTAGSKILSNFVPTYESTVSQRWIDDGSISLGKLNMDEFAMGSANITSFFGNVKNPWSQEGEFLTPGGSSGGSAAAVASFQVMGSLGSDTGGSIRQPAAFCGLVGIKPTYGSCSRYGMIAFASSLDQAGVFARSVDDVGILLESVMGYDEKDSTSVKRAPESMQNLNSSVKGMKIGIPVEFAKQNLDAEVREVWEKAANLLKEQGAEIVDVSLNSTKYGVSAYYVIAPAEASSNLARFDGVRFGLRVSEEGDSLNEMYEKTRSEGFGWEVKRRILIGTYVLSAGCYETHYKKALHVKKLILKEFSEAFEKVDAILTPTTPTAAFDCYAKIDPVTMYLNDIFTIPVNLAGLPALSVPAGKNSKGLPLGVQLIGNLFQERKILEIAKAIEKGIDCSFVAKI